MALPHSRTTAAGESLPIDHRPFRPHPRQQREARSPTPGSPKPNSASRAGVRRTGHTIPRRQPDAAQCDARPARPSPPRRQPASSRFRLPDAGFQPAGAPPRDRRAPARPRVRACVALGTRLIVCNQMLPSATHALPGTARRAANRLPAGFACQTPVSNRRFRRPTVDAARSGVSPATQTPSFLEKLGVFVRSATRPAPGSPSPSSAPRAGVRRTGHTIPRLQPDAAQCDARPARHSSPPRQPASSRFRLPDAGL